MTLCQISNSFLPYFVFEVPENLVKIESVFSIHVENISEYLKISHFVHIKLYIFGKLTLSTFRKYKPWLVHFVRFLVNLNLDLNFVVIS